MTPRSRIRRAVAALGAAAVVVALGSPRAAAQTVDGYVELTGRRLDDTSQNAGFAATRTDTDSIERRVNVTLSQHLFPNVVLSLGGFFEDEDLTGTVVGIPADTDHRIYRPFLRARLATPTVRGEVYFERVDTRDSADGFSVRSVRDAWYTTGGWFPDPQNYVQVRYAHAKDSLIGPIDARRSSALASVDSVSRPASWLTLQYRALYDVQNDHTLGSRSESNTDELRVAFADTYWDARLTLAADVNWTRFRSRQQSTVGGDVDIRVFPVAGLAAIDDTPERDPLAGSASLLDGNFEVGAGINLGLQPGDERRRNFGFDLGVPQRLNVLRVWTDREVRVETARAFSWEIWTSDDNDLWTFRRTIGSAPFGVFDNRFELVFEAVSARYVKVVVRPLLATDPFAADYPVIQVTELEAFERVPPGQNFTSFSRSSDRATLNARLRLLENVPLFYDLNYLRSSVESAGTSTSIVNGLTYSKAFSPVWSLTGRLANERAEAPGRDTQNTNLLSATVSASPLPTVSASLFLGGRQESLDDDDRDTYNAVVTGSATIYRGFDVTASFGGSRIEESTGRVTDVTLVNFGAQIAPRPEIVFGATIQDNSRTERGGGRPELEDPNRATELSITLNPLPTLYIYASRRVEERSEFLTDAGGERTIDNYSASWAPFPYGSLRLGFTWYETYDTQYDAVTTTWGPTLRWNIRPRWLFDAGFRDLENDSDLQRIDRREAYVTLRIGF